MSKPPVRALAWVRAASCLLLLLGVASCHQRAAPGLSHPTREQLIGTWRLVSIQIAGPDNPRPDPFYNDHPGGLLIYDRSGWMSVQIVNSPRPAMKAPASRPTSGAVTAEEAQLKAALLDTYYAYFGTWDFDEVASTVTHHVQSSLIPDEAGMSYSQAIHLDGNELTFTTPQEVEGRPAIQRKVWRRIAGSS